MAETLALCRRSEPLRTRRKASHSHPLVVDSDEQDYFFVHENLDDASVEDKLNTDRFVLRKPNVRNCPLHDERMFATSHQNIPPKLFLPRP